MNQRLSTTRSARSRGRTLLSIDKNYARRVDTLYRKAFEAPGAIADEGTRKRCRLAVMQELDGVCTVFLTHNDSSWPPTREQLKDYQVLYPQDYISVNQANGTLSGREPESDTSGDDGTMPLRLPKRSNYEAGARLLTLESAEARDTSLTTAGQAFSLMKEKQPAGSNEKVVSPSGECLSTTREIRNTENGGPYGFSSSPLRDTLSIEPVTPRRHQVEHELTSAFGGRGQSDTASPVLTREAFRRDRLSGGSIEPTLLCTPRNECHKLGNSTITSSDRSDGFRLPIRRDVSVSPSPRRRRAGVWRTYKAKVDSL